VRTIGIGIMSEYVLVFEVAGILLLMALIGARYCREKNFLNLKKTTPVCGTQTGSHRRELH